MPVHRTARPVRASARRQEEPSRADDLGYDVEPLTPEEKAAIEEGERAVARGDMVAWDEVKRDLVRMGGRRRAKSATDSGGRAAERPKTAHPRHR